jgi:hypothetical protein
MGARHLGYLDVGAAQRAAGLMRCRRHQLNGLRLVALPITILAEEDHALGGAVELREDRVTHGKMPRRRALRFEFSPEAPRRRQ